MLILLTLRSKYPDLLFKFKQDDYFQFFLLYKDRDEKNYMLSDKPEIVNQILRVVVEYLSLKEINELIVVYDYYNTQ